MCLIDKKQFRIAEKDIPIFKVVFKKKYSPFRRTPLFHHNETEGEANPSLIKEGRYEFGPGYFHALTTKEAAEKMISGFWHENCSIVTGYIPEGTRYAIEESSGYICARKMILNL
jgi:hypothetical protein